MEIRYEDEVLFLSGDFDVRHTAEVREAIHDVLMEHQDRVVIDVSGVSSVDLTALRVVGSATRLARRTGQLLVLRGCSPQVVRMLHLTRMIRVVHVDREPIPA